MWEIFEKLRAEAGVSVYKVCKDLGIGQSVISNWKAGRYRPKDDKRKLIAEYFGVSLDYLDTGIEDKEIELTRSDKDYLTILKNNPKLRTLLSVSNDLDEDDFNAVKDYAERLRRTYKD